MDTETEKELSRSEEDSVWGTLGIIVGLVVLGILIGRGTAPERKHTFDGWDKREIQEEVINYPFYDPEFLRKLKEIDPPCPEGILRWEGKCGLPEATSSAAKVVTTTILMEKQKCDVKNGILNIERTLNGERYIGESTTTLDKILDGSSETIPNYKFRISCSVPSKEVFNYEIK